MSRVLITGGTGFIGQGLVDTWLAEKHEIIILTRRPNWVKTRWNDEVKAVSDVSDITDSIDILVNLAGEGIADKPWTKKRKQQLRASRIDLTQNLVVWAKKTKQQFKQVISGSAVGIYGDCGEQIVDESFSVANDNDFAAKLCADWEAAATELKAFSEHFCIVRTGVVLGAGGGMIGRLWLPFKLGLGGRLGSGKQYLPWIHLDDERKAIEFLIQNKADGIYNLCAPNPVSNQELTNFLAKTLKRPAFLPIPSLAINLLFGEMGSLLLASQRVMPKHLQQLGFEFDYPEIEHALQQIKNR